MNCPYCGHPLVEGAKFCQGCGSNVQNIPVPMQAPTPVETPPENVVLTPPVPAYLSETPPTEQAPVFPDHISVPEQQGFYEVPPTSQVSIPPSQMGNHVPQKPESFNPPPKPPQKESNKTAQPKPKKGGKGALIAIILLTVLALAFAALNVLQYLKQEKDTEDHNAEVSALNATISERDNSISALEEEKSALEDTVADKDSEITELKGNSASKGDEIKNLEEKVATLNGTVESLKEEVEGLEDKAYYYDEIVRLMGNENVGYASENFHTDKGIIVLSKSNTDYQFTLTANWESGGTVTVDYSSDSSGIRFDSTSWTTTTTMTVEPYYEGINVLTFSNDVDSSTFQVLIIVTE